MAADMEFALEEEDHVLGGGALFKENIASFGHDFLAMPGEPEAAFEG
jgi:hypothetical protein